MATWQPDSGHTSIIVSRSGGVGRIELRHPARLNALDAESAVEFRDVLARLGRDDGVRSVLITGSGRAFSAGADVAAEFDDPASRSQVERVMHEVTTPTILAIRQMPKPVIAGVNGLAAGLGCSIALACDLVVAAESAYFLLAFARLGLTLDGGASILVPARVGLGRAFVMALLAERVGSSEALAWGLADRVVADSELIAVTEELAFRLANGPTRAYAATKELINAAQLAALPVTLASEAALQGRLLSSSDFEEGVRAFTHKRSPNFTGD